MSAVKLFISYRRADSEHAAQRVRERLQARFGDEGVFIDREMPAGVDWPRTLARTIDESTGVVVIMGERFIDLLRRDGDGDASDPMREEIVASMRAGKRVYPVVAGLRDMPTPQQLPADLHPLLKFNAVFAPAPYFDAAMDALIRAVESQHGWVAPPVTPAAAGTGAGPAAAAGGPAAGKAARDWQADLWRRWLLASAVVLLLMAACGSLIGWLAPLPDASTWQGAVWHGARYLLATLFLGLGPYLARWLVSELRARSFLPVNNLMGLLTALNLMGMLLTGGLFLLLSTIRGWRLEPLLPEAIFPGEPGAAHYVMLSLLLLGLVVAAVVLAIAEPAARRHRSEGRMVDLHTLHGLALLLLAGVAWFALSLATSVRVPDGTPLVPMVGYLMLCPAVSLLLGASELAPSRLGTAERLWPFRTLLAMIVALYVLVTLGLWSYGPVRVFADLG